MNSKSLGVAVIGAGMAGRSHAAGYRVSQQMYDLDLPEIRLVAIADAYEPFAVDAVKRYGFERAETDWEAIVAADDVDILSVVVANDLHRSIVEAALAAGKHVLCEKPLAPTVEDAKAMVAAAEAAETQAGVGFSYRRSPGVNAIRQQVLEGALGSPQHFSASYWCDYAQNPMNPISWRFKGGPGTGALADIGSHAIDVGEYLCGEITSVSGAVFQTFITERPVPVGASFGHGGGAVSDERAAVENEDLATFTAKFASGAIGTFSVSRVAQGLTNGLAFDLFAQGGRAGFDQNRCGEFTLELAGGNPQSSGISRVLLGPAHPHMAGSMAMDYPSVGFGQNDLFAWQCRAFLDQVAGIGKLPPLPSLAHGLHNLEIQAAITQSALNNGAAVTLA
jgi:predicted dehydrogenase